MFSRIPRLHPQLILFFGMVLMIGGFGLLWFQYAPAAAAQDSIDLSNARYIGADECASCHRSLARAHDESRHALTLQNVTRNKGPILADFSQGEAAREVLFPGDDAPRAFDERDIAFTVGTGRYVQRYLYEIGRREYRVLPAEWNVIAGEWRPLELGESWEDAAYDWDANCAFCHTTGLNFERGVWRDDGVQCESCHGPGSIHQDLARGAGRNPSDAELVDIRASANPAVDPQVCGQCHSLGSNPDGLPFPLGYIPGAELTDYFALSTQDQGNHWWVSGHASHKNMQYNEWLVSGHATSLVDLMEHADADDSCLTCHSSDYEYNLRLAAAVADGTRQGNEPPTVTLATAQFGVTCSSCHNPHLTIGLDANLVEETYPLCTSCHSNTPDGVHHPVREMFEGVPFIDNLPGYTGVHFTSENGPTCSSCHLPEVPIDNGSIRSSHTFHPVLSFDVEGLPDSCSSCHEAQASPLAMGQLIDVIQRDTQERIETARGFVSESTPPWVIRALDFVEGDGSLGIHNYTYSDALLDAVFDALNLFPVEAGQ